MSEREGSCVAVVLLGEVHVFHRSHPSPDTDGLLYDHASLRQSTYRLVFDVADYFKAKGVELPEPNFLNVVNLDFGVAQEDQHYHVRLLASPCSYSTYRGS